MENIFILVLKDIKKQLLGFERSGSKLLVFAYFIAGLRHLSGYVSGTSRIPFIKFIIPAYTGAFLWGLCFITLGKVLGPQWNNFHKAASKYLIIFIIAYALLIAGFFAFRFYKIQIKNFFIRVVKLVMERLKTIRAAEVFLIFLSVVLIGLAILMLGLAQDYLYNEFTQFNEIAEYVIHTVVYKSWMKGFLVLQQPFALGSIIVLTIIRVWVRGRNRLVEFLLLIISVLGGIPFRESMIEVFSFLRSFGFGGFHSANFPDFKSTIIMIVYGTCLFLLLRHSRNNYLTIVAALFALILLMGLAIVNIASTNVFPSDVVGGYVYGGVWIFFNFLLFEMLRLVLGR